MIRLFRKTSFLILASMLVSASLPACSAQLPHSGLEMAPMADMPAEVQLAAVSVQQAYQFAAANPELMKQVGCYCGCRDIGHTSNYDCYIADADGSEIVTYDNHALGCSICVDITQDVMRMVENGKPPGEITAAIDSTYSKYGTTNLP